MSYTLQPSARPVKGLACLGTTSRPPRAVSAGISLTESGQYELVPDDLRTESPKAGLKVLAHARMMHYEPTTPLITACRRTERPAKRSAKGEQAVLINSEQPGELPGNVPEPISERATRRLERELRHARN